MSAKPRRPVRPPQARIEEIKALITEVCGTCDVDASIAIAQCQAESNFDQLAVSSCGALGLFQLLPSTAADLGVDPLSWRANVLGGVRYLAAMKRKFGSYDKALAAYNWGPGNLAKATAKHGEDWREHLPAETTGYLKRILGSAAA